MVASGGVELTIMGHKETLWGDGNVLHHVLGGDYIWYVWLSKLNELSISDVCILVHANYSSTKWGEGSHTVPFIDLPLCPPFLLLGMKKWCSSPEASLDHKDKIQEPITVQQEKEETWILDICGASIPALNCLSLDLFFVKRRKKKSLSF